MRRIDRISIFLCVILVSCQGRPRSDDRFVPLGAEHAAAIRDSVSAFAESVATGVTTDGPAAWSTYFSNDSLFFMASEGRLVFPNSDSAARAIDNLTRVIAHIELHWGVPLRVDPLAPGLALVAAPYHEIRVDRQGRRVDEDGFFTGLAQHRGTRWEFRHAHWSVVVPPSPVP
jgi:hypothetical protein